MLDFAVNEFDGPIAIRYPRGSAYEGLHKYDVKIEYGRAEIIHQESEILLLALGSMVRVAESVYQELKQCNYNVTLVNLRFAKPLDEETIMSLLPTHKVVITLEENVLTGGISQQIAAHVQWSGIEGITCIPITLPDMYIEHGAQEILKKKYGITEETIIDKIRSLIS